jgi:hypothetical protein
LGSLRRGLSFRFAGLWFGYCLFRYCCVRRRFGSEHVWHNAFRCGGRKSLRDSLLSTAPASTAATTAAASATALAFSSGRGRPGLIGGIHGFFVRWLRFHFRFGRGDNF